MKKIIKIITCLYLFCGLFSFVKSAQADSTDYNQLLPQNYREVGEQNIYLKIMLIDLVTL